ncbi:mCG1036188, isoform CRA_a, partial [Mus musculus]
SPCCRKGGSASGLDPSAPFLPRTGDMADLGEAELLSCLWRRLISAGTKREGKIYTYGEEGFHPRHHWRCLLTMPRASVVATERKGLSVIKSSVTVAQ